MLEEGRLVPANPSCEEGWHYHNTSCYWFSSTRLDFEPAMDSCNEKGAYLTDILSQEENKFIKDILMVINPNNGTDFWAGRRCDGGRSPLDYQRSYSTTSTSGLRKENPSFT